MNLEDRLAPALLAVIFIGASAAGFAIGGTHPLFNIAALGLGAAFWWAAWEES